MTRARTLADMISDGVIGTTELADDAITPVKLDETGNYTIAQLTVYNGTSDPDVLFRNNGTGDVTLTFRRGAADDVYTDWSLINDNGTFTFRSDNSSDPDHTQLTMSQGDISFYDTSGNAKLFWDASAESLGIGTTSTGSETFVVEKSSGTPTIRINAPAGSEAQLKLQADGTVTDTQMIHANTDGSLGFSRWDGAAYQERMQIKSDGTTQLNGQLDFVDSGSKIVRPTANALGVNVGSIEAVRFTSSGGAIFNNTENINQNFTVKASGNSNAVFVDGNGGNVGIGTSSTSTNYGAYRTPLIVEHPQGYGYVEIRSGTTNNQAGLVINRQDNTGWLQAMNNNGKLRIAPMASIDQTGLTNAKDGSSGITIDTSGNIGLNEASPDKQLHLTTNTSGLITSGNNRQGSVIRLTHNVNHEAGYNGGDFLGGIEFESSDSSAGGGVRTAIKTEAIDPYNTHSLKFYTADSNSTNMPERMSINHRGHVTTPYQPAFSFPSSTNFSVTTTGYRYMNSSNVFANVAAGTSLNVGNHFNTSNGRFTAPVNGVYEFNLTYGVILYSGYFLVYLEKNLSGSYYSIYNPTNQDGDWMFGTLNWKTFLYSGDFVTPMWNNNYSGGNLGHVKFSGHLIG